MTTGEAPPSVPRDLKAQRTCDNPHPGCLDVHGLQTKGICPQTPPHDSQVFSSFSPARQEELPKIEEAVLHRREDEL